MTENTFVIKCHCGRLLHLSPVGGQEEHAYSGRCDCDRNWWLEDISRLEKNNETT